MLHWTGDWHYHYYIIFPGIHVIRHVMARPRVTVSEEFIDLPEPLSPDGYPDKALLAFTRMELKIIRSLKAGGQEKAPMFGGMTQVTFWPDLILAGPILGAPQAAMALEVLSRRGVQSFLSLGWCGSLQSDLSWGDIVLPLSAVSEEGTSQHYPSGSSPAKADPELSGRLIQALEERGQRFAKGRVWTTDAPYRETRDRIRTHAEAGILAVDMETSAMMSVCRFRELAWAGLMVVSDELWGEKWRPGFHSTELRTGLKRAAETILAVWT